MDRTPLPPVGRVALGYTSFAHAPVPRGFAVSPWPSSAGGRFSHTLHEAFQDQGYSMRRGFQDTHGSGNVADRLALDLRAGGDNAGKLAVVCWTADGGLALYHRRWPRFHAQGDVWMVLTAEGEALVVSPEGRLVPARLLAQPGVGQQAWKALFAWISTRAASPYPREHRLLFRPPRGRAADDAMPRRADVLRQDQVPHHRRPWPPAWWRRWGAVGTLAALEPVVRSLAALPRPVRQDRKDQEEGLAPWMATLSDPLSTRPKLGPASEDARPLMDALAAVLPYAEHLHRQQTGKGFATDDAVTVYAGDLMPDGTTDLPFPAFPVGTFRARAQAAVTEVFRHLVAPHARRAWAGQQAVIRASHATPPEDALGNAFLLRETLLSIPMERFTISAHQRLQAIPQATHTLDRLRRQGLAQIPFVDPQEGFRPL